MRLIKVKYNQSLVDVALEQYGDVQGVYWIVEDNGLNGIIDNIEAGEEIIIREEYMNKKVAEEMQVKGVATLDDASKGGIGWWAIDKDFVVM